MLRAYFAIVLLSFILYGQVYADEKSPTYVFGKIGVFPGSFENETVEVCLKYPEDYYNFSPEKIYVLKNYSHIDLCETNLTSGSLISESPSTIFLLTVGSNCTGITRNFKYALENGTGLILISEYIYRLDSSYDLEAFGVITPKDSKKLWILNNPKANFHIHLYGGGGFDASTALLGLLAVFCVVVGSYSGPYLSLPGANEPRILENSENSQQQDKTNEVTINIVTVVILVVFITITLLSLYFFFDYLVYVFIGIFCIASTRGTYCIFLQLMCYFDTGVTVPKIRNYGLHEILLAIACLSIAIVWFVFRHYSFSWIIQDFLGVCFCIHIIQSLRLPSLKICTVLLLMLFIYDIFFVFITPLFMSNGKSIMVEVATGGGSNSSETIPLLLKIPRLQNNPCAISQYSLLGFGDIIVPGFLVCFAHSFDIMIGSKCRPYLISTSIGYSVGLFGAFVALYLMSTGQPALLYIVPATLITIFSVGAIRKETKALWLGALPETYQVSDVSA